MHIKGRFLTNEILLGFRVTILVIGSVKNYVSYQLLLFIVLLRLRTPNLSTVKELFFSRYG